MIGGNDEEDVREGMSYKVTSTSNASATVNDIPLDPPEEEDASLTRRIARPLLVDNVHDKTASVKITLMHQRRATTDDEWQDADSYSLATLKAGQQVRLPLNAEQTRRLFLALRDLYELGGTGIPSGEADLVVVDQGQSLVVSSKARKVISHF